MPRLNAIPPGCAFNPRCPRRFARCLRERPELLAAGDQPRRLLAACRCLKPLLSCASAATSTSRGRGSTACSSASRGASCAPSTASRFEIRARRDARAGRRVGLRQVDRRAPDRRPVRAERGPHRVPRPAHADDLPGPLREPESALARARHHRRAARVLGSRDERKRARRRAAAAGRPVARRRREVPARVLRRPAPAHLDRARARRRARAPGLRRADLGARRLGAGADPEPDDRPAGAPRPHLPLHLAQPGGGVATSPTASA